MQFAHVRGNVVASIVDAGFASRWRLLLKPLSAADTGDFTTYATARASTALDLLGGGVGETALVPRRDAARVASDGRLPLTSITVIASSLRLRPTERLISPRAGARLRTSSLRF